MSKLVNRLPLPPDVAERRLLARVAVQAAERLRTVSTPLTDIYRPLLGNIVAACDDPEAKAVSLPDWPVDEDGHPWSIGAVLDVLEHSAVKQLDLYNDEAGAAALRGFAARLKDATGYRAKKAPRRFGQAAREAVAA